MPDDEDLQRDQVNQALAWYRVVHVTQRCRDRVDSIQLLQERTLQFLDRVKTQLAEP